MSVHSRSGGRFEVMWRAPQHTRKCKAGCSKSVHQHSRRFDDETEANRFDAKMITAVATMRDAGGSAGILPERPVGTVRTFGAVARDVIGVNRNDGTWSTGYGYQMSSTLRNLGTLADMPVDAVAHDLAGARRAVSMFTRPKRAISLIKATMAHAVASGDIDAHGLSGLAYRQRTPDTAREFVFATPEQLATVAAKLDAWRPGMGLAIALMRSCGLRTGEALAVHASDFREDCTMLRVSRQVGSDGKVCSLKAKQASSYRDVPVPTMLAGKLAKHIAGLTGAKLFAGAQGAYVARGTFNKTCRDGANSAGLPEAWIPYMARHHYASELISKRVQIDRVAKLLGHSKIEQTYSTYSHFLPNEMDDVRAILDAA